MKDNLPLFVLTHRIHKVMTISLMLGKNMISLNIQTVFFTGAVCLGPFKYDITLFFTITPLTLTTFHIVIFFKRMTIGSISVNGRDGGNFG